MDEKSIQRLSRDECIEKLKEIGQHGPEERNSRRNEDETLQVFLISKTISACKI